MAAVILQAQGLSRDFGGLRAVDGVDFALQAGEIHALIGPNGAGKTTFVSLLSGRIAPDAGKIMLSGEDITRLPAHQRVRRGIAYTFQITSVYARLPVFDNVALAAQSRGVRDLSAAVDAVLDRVGMAGMGGRTRVRQMCRKALQPAAPALTEMLAKIPNFRPIPAVAAVCVYPLLVPHAVAVLQGSGVHVASVATSFPSGQTTLASRLVACMKR